MHCFFNYCSWYKAGEGSFKGGSMRQSDWRLAWLYIRRLDVKIIGACAGRGLLWSGRLGPPAGSGAWLMAEPYVNQHPPSLPQKNTSQWSRSENWVRNTRTPSSPPPSFASVSSSLLSLVSLCLSLHHAIDYLLFFFLYLFPSSFSHPRVGERRSAPMYTSITILLSILRPWPRLLSTLLLAFVCFKRLITWAFGHYLRAGERMLLVFCCFGVTFGPWRWR